MLELDSQCRSYSHRWHFFNIHTFLQLAHHYWLKSLDLFFVLSTQAGHELFFRYLQLFYCTFLIVIDLALLGLLANIAVRITASLALGHFFLAFEQKVFVARPEKFLFIFHWFFCDDKVFRRRMLLIAAKGMIATDTSIWACACLSNTCDSRWGFTEIVAAAHYFHLHRILWACFTRTLKALFQGGWS